MSMITLSRITCLAILLSLWAVQPAMTQDSKATSNHDDPNALNNDDRHRQSSRSRYGSRKYYDWNGPSHSEKKKMTSQIVRTPSGKIIYKRASLVGAPASAPARNTPMPPTLL